MRHKQQYSNLILSLCKLFERVPKLNEFHKQSVKLLHGRCLWNIRAACTSQPIYKKASSTESVMRACAREQCKEVCILCLWISIDIAGIAIHWANKMHNLDTFIPRRQLCMAVGFIHWRLVAMKRTNEVREWGEKCFFLSILFVWKSFKRKGRNTRNNTPSQSKTQTAKEECEVSKEKENRNESKMLCSLPGKRNTPHNNDRGQFEKQTTIVEILFFTSFGVCLSRHVRDVWMK